jgi:transcription initiation factor IIE alpha subunit
MFVRSHIKHCLRSWSMIDTKGHVMTTQYKDRFSEAEKELSEKSAFICESCKTKYGKDEARKRNMNCCGKTLSEVAQ